MLEGPAPRKLLELIPVRDDFCTELATIEEVGGCARLVFASDQTLYETGETMCVVQLKTIMEVDAVHQMVALLTRFLAQHEAKTEGQGRLRVVA